MAPESDLIGKEQHSLPQGTKRRTGIQVGGITVSSNYCLSTPEMSYCTEGLEHCCWVVSSDEHSLVDFKVALLQVTK